jgi:hypothetical protein
MKDRMLELARKEGYIDSIFNYCDRWCERCAFTAKCRNYESSKDAPDPDSPELWEYLHNILSGSQGYTEKKPLCSLCFPACRQAGLIFSV